ncbi:MAG: Asp-tRNA(Asn)/Glu-tRNA(Gln) amidotransferase subunit GatC [Candidatus Pelagibacterales bacterium]|jgi:aspartyl-tRNA(Asn)/glutamyl-tRNA(Gln) amidotransferase subunit C|tara:strand:- start:533 stop:823 length:291 start_codon:yes stop_codon:yes gene_type:complete
MIEFNKKITLKLAKLSRLSLSNSQLENLEKDLTSILSFIDQLKEINTDSIDPTSNSLDQNLILRDDLAEDVLSNEKLLQNVPESELGFFVVPKVIE